MAMTGSTKPDDVVPVSDQVVAVPVMAQATLLENAATTKANGKSCTCVKGIHIAQMTLGILYLLNGVTCFLPSPFLGGATPWQFGIIHCLLGAFAIYASTLFNPCGCCTDPKPGQAKIISIASALSALMAVVGIIVFAVLIAQANADHWGAEGAGAGLCLRLSGDDRGCEV